MNGNNKELLHLAEGYYNEALVNFENDHLEDAVPLLQKATQIYESLEENETLIECIAKLGVVYSETGKSDMAVDSYIQALDLCYGKDLIFTQARLYNNIGNELSILHDFKQARTLFIRAYELMKDDRAKKDPRYNILLLVITLNLKIKCLTLNLEQHVFMQVFMLCYQLQ